MTGKQQGKTVRERKPSSFQKTDVRRYFNELAQLANDITQKLREKTKAGKLLDTHELAHLKLANEILSGARNFQVRLKIAASGRQEIPTAINPSPLTLVTAEELRGALKRAKEADESLHN